MRAAGGVLLVLMVFVAVAAPWLAPNPPDQQFDTYLYAPPTPFHWTSFSSLRLINRLERRFEVREQAVPVRWFGAGHFVSSTDENAPLLLLGADSYGRDIFARLVYGGRASLGISALATLITMIVGAAIGGIAGYAGGAVDESEDADEQREHLSGRQHQRHHRAQREHHIDGGQDQHEIRKA